MAAHTVRALPTDMLSPSRPCLLVAAVVVIPVTDLRPMLSCRADEPLAGVLGTLRTISVEMVFMIDPVVSIQPRSHPAINPTIIKLTPKIHQVASHLRVPLFNPITMPLVVLTCAYMHTENSANSALGPVPTRIDGYSHQRIQVPARSTG